MKCWHLERILGAELVLVGGPAPAPLTVDDLLGEAAAAGEEGGEDEV